MIAFKISLNSKDLCTAGIGDVGVLMSTLNWVRRPKERAEADEPEEEITLHVGGLHCPSDQHYEWGNHTLSVGDEVLIRVVATDTAPTPPFRAPVRRLTHDELVREKEYVRNRATEWGWKVTEPSDNS